MSSSRRRPERRLSIAQGRDAREIQLPPSAGKCFLLTSPFIERMRHIILRKPVAAARLVRAPEHRETRSQPDRSGGFIAPGPMPWVRDVVILERPTARHPRLGYPLRTCWRLVGKKVIGASQRCKSPFPGITGSSSRSTEGAAPG